MPTILNMTPEQLLRLEKIEKQLSMLIASDRYIFQRNLQFLDGRNFQFATGTGSKIGLSASEKLSFHGQTPVAQRSGASQAAVATTAATQTTPWGYTTQAQADGIITLLNELRASLVAKGIIKGSS